MFSTREVPWAKIGSVIDLPGVTAEEAAILGGLDFEVKPEPAGYFRDGKWHAAPNRFALVRQDTGEVFNYATTSYQPIQYAEAFGFIDGINPEIVAAGSLRDGRQGFIVAKLPELFDVSLKLRDGRTDPHELYVLLRTSTDLTHGIEIMLTTLRGRCMNQLTLPSLKKNVPQLWSIRHTRNAHTRLAQARSIITAIEHYTDAFESITSRLADIDIDFDQASKLLMHVLPDKPKRDEQIDGILTAFKDEETNGFTGTGWGLTNAVDEYFEWTRPEHRRTAESRFLTGLEGQAHKFTARTAQLLLASR